MPPFKARKGGSNATTPSDTSMLDVNDQSTSRIEKEEDENMVGAPLLPTPKIQRSQCRFSY